MNKGKLSYFKVLKSMYGAFIEWSGRIPSNYKGLDIKIKLMCVIDLFENLGRQIIRY